MRPVYEYAQLSSHNHTDPNTQPHTQAAGETAATTTTTTTIITIVWVCASCGEAAAFVANSLNSCRQQAEVTGDGKQECRYKGKKGGKLTARVAIKLLTVVNQITTLATARHLNSFNSI